MQKKRIQLLLGLVYVLMCGDETKRYWAHLWTISPPVLETVGLSRHLLGKNWEENIVLFFVDGSLWK